ALLLRRRAGGGDLAAHDALRPDGRGPRRPRRPGARAQGDRPRARARARVRRRLVHQRDPRSGRLPPRGPGLDGDLKITVLAPHVRIAGGVRAILTYADRLAARGHEVTLVVPARGALRARWANARGRGPEWVAGFRPRVRWVSRWQADALPEGD